MKQARWKIAAVLVSAVAVTVTVFGGGWVASADEPRWAWVNLDTSQVFKVSEERPNVPEGHAVLLLVPIPEGMTVVPLQTAYIEGQFIPRPWGWWIPGHTASTATPVPPTATPAPGGTGIAPTPAPTATPTVGPTATPTPVPTPRIFSGDTNAELEALWLEVDALRARIAELEGK